MTDTTVAALDTTNPVAQDGQTSGNAPAPADTTGAAATPPADTAAEEQEPKRQGDGGFQRRINRLTREKHEALGRLDALQREVDELRTTRTSTPASGASDQEPRQDQFQRYEDYVAARAEWRAERKVAAAIEEVRRTAQTNSAEQSNAQRFQAFQSKMASQGKGIEGFDEVMETLTKDSDFPMSRDMSEYLMEEADNAALLGKWLTDNPDEAERISRLRPTAQVKELAKVDGQLGSKPAPRTTKAPAPVSTVGGSASPSGKPKVTDMNAWAEWYKKQL